MPELGLMPPLADARVTPPRIDAALEAMVGRLGRALEAVGDEQAARFLRSLAPDPGAPAADGGVIGLPQGDLQPIDRLIKALGIGAAERDLLVLSLVGHCHEGVAAILRGLHPEGRPWATLGLAATLAERGCLAGLTSRAQLRDALNASVLLRYGALITEGGGPAPSAPCGLPRICGRRSPAWAAGRKERRSIRAPRRHGVWTDGGNVPPYAARSRLWPNGPA